MSEDLIATLEAAEKTRNDITERITERDRRRAQIRAQVDQHEEQGERYRAIPSSKLVSNDMLNEEKRIRSLAAYRDLLARLDAEDEADRDRLRIAQQEIDRARLPLVLAELSQQAQAVGTIVNKIRAEAAREFTSLASLRRMVEGLGGAISDPIAAAWSVVTGAEIGTASEPGLFADKLLVEIAKAVYSVGRIEESTRTAAAQRAGEAAARIEIGSMSDSERLASVRSSLPGWGRTGTARRDQLDTAELARDREQFGHLLPRVVSDE